MIQLLLAVFIALAAVVYLVWPEGHSDESSPLPPEAEIVKLVKPHLLTIVPGTPLEKKLQVAEVDKQTTTAPLLKVTGAVVGAAGAAASRPAD